MIPKFKIGDTVRHFSSPRIMVVIALKAHEDPSNSASFVESVASGKYECVWIKDNDAYSMDFDECELRAV